MAMMILILISWGIVLYAWYKKATDNPNDTWIIEYDFDGEERVTCPYCKTTFILLDKSLSEFECCPECKEVIRNEDRR